MEADLARYYQADLRDHWRRDDHGRRRLTLRQIHVRVANLPLDSAVSLLDGHGWQLTDYLLADLFVALTGEQHPADPRPKKGEVTEVQRRAWRVRQAQREARLQRKAREEATE